MKVSDKKERVEMSKEKNAYSSAEEEMEARQKRLIPLNIVVAIIALFAAISILFLPLLSINVDDVSELMSQESDGDGGQEGGVAGGAEDNETARMMSGMSFSVSLNGAELMKVGFSGSVTETIVAKAGEMLGDNANELAARALIIAADADDVEMDDEKIEAVSGALRGLEKAKGDEEIDAAIDSLVNEVREQFDAAVIPEDDAEAKEGLREMYDETVSHTGGEFSTEAFICVTASGSLNEGEDGSGEVYTSFTELLNASLASEEGAFAEIDATIPKGALVGIGAAIAFFAFVWFVLFLFALVRIFLKNKRFTMWYVKLFGFFPCLIFGVAPLVAGSVVPEAAAVMGMISSLSWISGACYILLWLISIFWAFPMKRRIRKLKKEIG